MPTSLGGIRDRFRLFYLPGSLLPASEVNSRDPETALIQFSKQQMPWLLVGALRHTPGIMDFKLPTPIENTTTERHSGIRYVIQE